MPLIDPPQAQPSPPTKSVQQLQVELYNRVKGRNSRLFRMMRDTYTENAADLLANSGGLSPQQGFDAMGSEGVEIMELSDILVTAANSAAQIAGLDASFDLPTESPIPLTRNQDGTVTVTEQTGP